MNAATRRIAWGVGDQAVSSATNFVLAVLLARTLTAVEFGAFAIAFSTYALALGTCRALVSEPLAVRYSDAPAEVVRHAAAGAAGVTCVVGTLAGALAVGAGVVAGGDLRACLLPFGLLLPGLLLQDSWRAAFVVAGHPQRAFVNDVIWAAAMLVFLSVALLRPEPGIVPLVLAWGGAAWVAAAVGAVQARTIPVLSGWRRWVSAHSDLGRRYVVEFVAMTGAWQLSMYLIGIISGLGAVGALRAAQTVLGPVNVIFLAVPFLAVPELARIRARRPDRLVAASATISATLAAVVLAWGVALWLAGDGLGSALLGQSWPSARAVLGGMVVLTAASGVNIGAIAGLRALGAAGASMRARLLLSPVVLLGGAVGAAAGGAGGAVAGLAAAHALATVVWWRQLRTAAVPDRAPVADEYVVCAS